MAAISAAGPGFVLRRFGQAIAVKRRQKLGYAQNIDWLAALDGAVRRMVARPVETGVKGEHYPKVAAALLPAIRDVLGEDVYNRCYASCVGRILLVPWPIC